MSLLDWITTVRSSKSTSSLLYIGYLDAEQQLKLHEQSCVYYGYPGNLPSDPFDDFYIGNYYGCVVVDCEAGDLPEGFVGGLDQLTDFIVLPVDHPFAEDLKYLGWKLLRHDDKIICYS